MTENSTFHNHRSRAGLLALIAVAASLLIGGQLYLIILQGTAACFNEGCEIVEGLTKVSPLVFNLFGLFFFLLIALTAVFVRIRSAGVPFLSLLLLAAMAAEGVLLAYQYHVARAWCSYCLVIFGLVALCNVLVGFRQLLNGIVLVAAVNLIFALLRFEPAIWSSPESALAAGTAAIRPGPEHGRSIALIYANDCPHCMTLLQQLTEFPRCEIRLNPIDGPPPDDIPELERKSSFQPEINRLLLRLLAIDTVPVLLTVDNDGNRIIRSGPAIEADLRVNCGNRAKDDEQSTGTGPNRSESRAVTPNQFLPPFPDDEGCQVDVICPEPMTSPAQ